MTIEERLEKLTERHEALTETIELQNSLWNDRFARLDNQISTVVGMIERMGSAIETLSRIAELHEHRLDTLEGGTAN